MGLEWHNRSRDSRGRWASREHCQQIHIYCTTMQWRTIKYAALMAGEEVSEYCRTAAMARAKAEANKRDLTKSNTPCINGKTDPDEQENRN